MYRIKVTQEGVFKGYLLAQPGGESYGTDPNAEYITGTKEEAENYAAVRNDIEEDVDVLYEAVPFLPGVPGHSVH